MSSSLNRVMLIGNIGKIEVREFAGGKVASISLATTERAYTTKAGKSVPEKTEWHNLTVWGSTAEFVEKYLDKGASIYVEGRIAYEEYEKDGVKKYTTKINVDNLKPLSSTKKKDEAAGGYVPETPSVTPSVQDDDMPF